MNRRICLYLAALAAFGLPCGADAQVRSVAEELRLNLHGGGVLLGSRAGAGPGFSAAYGNTRWFAAFVTLDRAGMTDGELSFTLQHVDVGARVHLRDAAGRLVPFALAAWTWRSARYGERFFMGDTLDVTVHGTGPTVGGGAQYYVVPRLAVEASAKVTAGAMERVTADGVHFRSDEAAIRRVSVRLKLGASWYPHVPHGR